MSVGEKTQTLDSVSETFRLPIARILASFTVANLSLFRAGGGSGGPLIKTLTTLA